MEALFHGALSIRRDGEWMQPLRFTEKQLESYTTTEALRIRSVSPAGVKIAFYSAAKTLSLSYKIQGRARAWAAFDLVQDGILKDSATVWDDAGQVTFSLSGDKTVKTEIYLPHLVEIFIKDSKTDSQLYPAKRKEKFWLCLGDSITQGMDAVHPSLTYPALAARLLDMDVLNTGVGGGVFQANNLEYIGRDPDMITIALGCNDWGQAKDKAAFAENIRAYLEKLTKLYTCKNVFGILPIWRSDAETIRSGMTFTEMRAVIRAEYEKYPFIRVLDGMDLVPPKPCFYGDAGELKAHPNAEGFFHYAHNLVKAIK